MKNEKVGCWYLPETTPIHWTVGVSFVYLGATLGFFLTGLLLLGNDSWRRWSIYSLIASGMTIVLVAITFYTFSPDTRPPVRVGGVMERVPFIEILAWYVTIGWRLWRRPQRTGR